MERELTITMKQWMQARSRKTPLEGVDDTTDLIPIAVTVRQEDTMEYGIKIKVDSGVSHSYQSVHFGVELSVEGVPKSELGAVKQEMETLGYSTLQGMEGRAQRMLDALVDTENRRGR